MNNNNNNNNNVTRADVISAADSSINVSIPEWKRDCLVYRDGSGGTYLGGSNGNHGVRMNRCYRCCDYIGDIDVFVVCWKLHSAQCVVIGRTDR